MGNSSNEVFSTQSKNNFTNVVFGPSIKYQHNKWIYGVQIPFYANLKYNFERPGLMSLGKFANPNGDFATEKRFLYGIGVSFERHISKRFSVSLEQNFPLKPQFKEALVVHNQVLQTNLILTYTLKK